ncbi:hypothetical protein GCM10009601_56210 [Streptomyces thermospinosisporus]|uniref:Uncharacterized protein n=1 Tax=Streptomyces thermospinosisporus TaxID=161482 RepID=A0ABP4JWT7_9ACTN
MRSEPDSEESCRPRRLPWSRADGKTAYVIADPERPGRVSRLADAAEDVQLEMAGVLLGHARQLADEAGPQELRYLVAELTRSLSDILRIAQRVKR